uniref:Uncharacterized protein n=1 Tax=Oryza nivara TaxID=4536 RepID=A0A0E0J1S6_ORYNI
MPEQVNPSVVLSPPAPSTGVVATTLVNISLTGQKEQVPMMLEFSLASVAWTLQRAMGVGQRMGSPSRSMRYPSWRANHGSRGCRPCVR